MEATGAKEPSDRLEQFLKVAISAAEMAGGVISDAWDKTKVVEHKGRSGLVPFRVRTRPRAHPKD